MYDYVEDTVVSPCLVEDESYAIRSRKLAVLCLAVMMSNALTMGLPMTIIIGLYDPNYGSFVLAGAMLHMFVFSSVVPYAYLRATREMPQWMVDLQVWSTLPTLIAASLFMHQVSIEVVCVVVAMVAIMLRARLWWLFMLLMLSLIVFTRLVVDFASELPGLHSTFFREQLLVERIVYTLGCSLCPPAFMCVGLFFVVQQFVQRSEEADAAIHMNLAVAEKLRAYDMDGMADILVQHESKVDVKLLTAFTAIQHNLQEYRPHIPDYVIAATTTIPLSSDDEGEVVSYNNDSETRTKSDFSKNSNSLRELSLRIPMESILSGTSSPIDDALDIVSSFTLTTDRHHHHPPRHNHHNNNNTSASANHHHLATISNYVSRSPINVSLDGGFTPTGGSSGGAAVVRQESMSNVMNLTPRVHATSSVRSFGAHHGDTLSSTSHFSTTQSEVALPPPSSSHHLTSHHHHPEKRSGGVGNMNTGHASNTTMSRGAAYASLPEAYVGRATTVFVRFIADEIFSASGAGLHLFKSDIVSKLNMCVGIAVKHAKANGGALQYMQGCGLMVSFNAASRISAHESKACHFASSLRHEISRLNEDVRITGHVSIVTSNVLSFFAGGRGGGQLVLTVLGDFMEQHTALHGYISQTLHNNNNHINGNNKHIPTQHDIIVMSKNTLSAAESHYEVRALGAVVVSIPPHVQSTPSSSSKCRRTSSSHGQHQDHHQSHHWQHNHQPVLVYELLASRHSSSSTTNTGGRNEIVKAPSTEWLYAFGTNKHEGTNTVVSLALDGKYEAAVQKLQSLGFKYPLSEHPSTSLVKTIIYEMNDAESYLFDGTHNTNNKSKKGRVLDKNEKDNHASITTTIPSSSSSPDIFDGDEVLARCLVHRIGHCVQGDLSRFSVETNITQMW